MQEKRSDKGRGSVSDPIDHPPSGNGYFYDLRSPANQKEPDSWP